MVWSAPFGRRIQSMLNRNNDDTSLIPKASCIKNLLSQGSLKTRSRLPNPFQFSTASLKHHILCESSRALSLSQIHIFVRKTSSKNKNEAVLKSARLPPKMELEAARLL